MNKVVLLVIETNVIGNINETEVSYISVWLDLVKISVKNFIRYKYYQNYLWY